MFYIYYIFIIIIVIQVAQLIPTTSLISTSIDSVELSGSRPIVIAAAMCIQVVWEHVDRLWLAGDVLCRLLKYAQSFAIMSSVNMLVVLSVDRHQAIRRPLCPPPSVSNHIAISKLKKKYH